jgi:hypothetical protein
MSDEPQPIPVEAYFVGDHITHLVVILSTDTIDEACVKVADMMVGRRIPARENATYVLSVDGQVVPGHLKVAESPITPLGNVTVNFES